MKSILSASLVNDPFGDPGLLVQFLYEKRALLFDLGDISSLNNSDLLKVSHVFVSHTHIDHFIGFDRLLRTVFGREKTLTLFGPENFIKNVEGKLAGFTWNLVDRYDESLTINVVEVQDGKLLKATFRAIEKFQLSDKAEAEFKDGVIFEDDSILVRAAILEHRVPCLGFSLEEKLHVNINKDRLETMQVIEGPWLNELKQSVFEEKPESFSIDVPFKKDGKPEMRQISLGQLKEDLVDVSPGQKISYVVDTVYNEPNKKRIVDLVQSSEKFFCESPFLADEEERGRERCHLTSHQAGTLAREAGVKQLSIFHFSRRHVLQRERFYKEAESAFRGTMDPNSLAVKKLILFSSFSRDYIRMMIRKSSYPKPSFFSQFFIRLRQVLFPGSQDYWQKRYLLGGNSGRGSYGENAEFKSRVLNNFVRESNIQSVTEFGCGDGNQLTYADYPQYIGLDISEEAIKLSSALFEKDSSKQFFIYNPDEMEENKQKFSSDLVLSLDVIYHLVEDGVYHKYLTNVFNSARKYVVIYSSNEETQGLLHSRHVRHRKFTRDIEEWFPSWTLIETVRNEVAPNGAQGKEPSVDFFIFQSH